MIHSPRSTFGMLSFALVAVFAAVCPAHTWAQAFSILEPPSEDGSTVAPQNRSEELPLPPVVDRDAPPPPTYDPGPADAFKTDSAPPNQPLPSRGELVDRVVLHEAFATAAQGVVSAGPIVRQPPPQNIVERPTTQPRGTNVTWIDGYWAWHPVRQTYYWVSGLWREIPPGRVWVAGQWFSAPGGYRWSNGYWDSATSPAPIFAQRPPNSMEVGPTAASQPDSFWMPGEFVWRNDSYVFQSGFWTGHQDEFIWQPTTYVQTPNGYAHVSGYWDFELETRGAPFAPLSVPVEMARQMQLSVTPSVLLAPDATLCLHTFTQPGDSHYYFGSYYGATDINPGLLPWHDPRSAEYSGSPLLSYYEWKFARQGIPFSTAMANYQSRYRSQAAMRPSVRAMSINGQAYATTDPLSSSARSLRQLLVGGDQVASNQRSYPLAPPTTGRASSLRPSSGLPQADRSLSSSQLSRQSISVPSARVLVPGISFSITGPSTIPRGIPRVAVPGIRLGIPGIGIPPTFGPSPIGGPWNSTPPIGVSPGPQLPPIGPPGFRRGMRR